MQSLTLRPVFHLVRTKNYANLTDFISSVIPKMCPLEALYALNSSIVTQSWYFVRRFSQKARDKRSFSLLFQCNNGCTRTTLRNISKRERADGFISLKVITQPKAQRSCPLSVNDKHSGKPGKDSIIYEFLKN